MIAQMRVSGPAASNFCCFLCACVVVVLCRVLGVVIDIHGIGPTCLLLLLCVCPGVLREIGRARRRGQCRDGWGSYQDE